MTVRRATSLLLLGVLLATAAACGARETTASGAAALRGFGLDVA